MANVVSLLLLNVCVSPCCSVSVGDGSVTSTPRDDSWRDGGADVARTLSNSAEICGESNRAVTSRNRLAGFSAALGFRVGLLEAICAFLSLDFGASKSHYPQQ